MTLPTDARARILEPAASRLSALPTCAAGAIPISEAAWSSGWDDLQTDVAIQGVSERASRLIELESSDARELRSSAEALVDEVATLLANLRALAVFAPGGSASVELHDALRASALAALSDAASDAVASSSIVDVAKAMSSHRLAASGAGEPDGWLELFGVPESTFIGLSGQFSEALFYARFYQQKDWMAERLAAIVEPLAGPTMPVPKRLYVVRMLLRNHAPVLSVWTGQKVSELIVREVVANPDRTVEILLDYARRYAMSFSNIERVRASQRRVEEATTPMGRAEEQLDLYRRMIEGQVRPWASTIARLLGAEAAMPEVGRLRALLDARADDPLARAFRDVLLPAARNAGAHEDFHFDVDRNQLVTSESVVDLAEIDRATWTGYALMIGAEIGVVCARSQDSRLISPEQRGETPPIAQMEKTAIEEFGQNGLQVLRWSRTRDLFVAEVEELSGDVINHGFQALLWASRFLPDCAEYALTVREVPVMRVPREALESIYQVWALAQTAFPYIPTSVWLRPNLACRLAVETFNVADSSLAWLLLDDGVRAYDEFHAGEHDLDTLHARIAIAHMGGQVALAGLHVRTQGRLYQAVARIERFLGAVARRDRSGMERAFARVLGLQDSLPVPSDLPTWDPRPLNQR